MELFWVAAGIVSVTIVIIVLTLIIGKWVNDKNKKELMALKQMNEPITVVVHSSKLNKLLSKCKKQPSKKYGTGVMVSGNGPSLAELIRMKKKKIKDEESAQKRKIVKQASAFGPTTSFAEEIQIAHSVIVGEGAKAEKKSPYPGSAKRECGRSLSFLWLEPSDTNLSNTTDTGKVQPATNNMQGDMSRAYAEKMEGYKHADRREAGTKGLETSRPYNETRYSASENERQEAKTGATRKGSSEFVFGQAVVVGGTTKKAQLRKAPEAGKVVKALSGRRGSSFDEDLRMGKSVILHEGENSSEQHKGMEHRKVIKAGTSNHRRESLKDNILFAKSVILPDEATQARNEKATKNRKMIKVGSKTTTGRRRSSMLDDIRFARSVIVQDHKATARGSVAPVTSSEEKAEIISQQIRQTRSNKRRRSSVISSF